MTRWICSLILALLPAMAQAQIFPPLELQDEGTPLGKVLKLNCTGAGTVGHYTANPTINGTVGTMSRRWVGMPIATTAGSFPGENVVPAMDASLLDKPVVLRGTAQQLALNGNGTALPAGAANWYCSFTWIED